MSLDFNKIKVQVNSQNIMAETASLSQDGEQKPIYILNNISPFDSSPSNLKNSLILTYYVEPQTDPNYLIISGWKNTNATGNLQATINLGDIIFTGYLNSYSFNITPNNPIRIQAGYSIFTPITGNFTHQVSVIDNTDKSSGIAHYWSANFLLNNNSISDNNILQADYSFDSNITPYYSLGNIYPYQISCLEATENFNIISEVQNNVNFSGNNLINLFNMDNIKLKNLASILGGNTYQIDFNLSGFLRQTEKVDIKNEDMILFQSTFNKNY